MIAVAVSQRSKVAAVEINSHQVNVIRILVAMESRNLKPKLALLLINPLDLAHHIFAGGDGMLDLACALIKQIQVVPSRSFAHPDQFVALIDSMQIELLGITDKGLAGFIDHDPGFGRVDVD